MIEMRTEQSAGDMQINPHEIKLPHTSEKDQVHDFQQPKDQVELSSPHCR